LSSGDWQIVGVFGVVSKLRLGVECGAVDEVAVWRDNASCLEIIQVRVDWDWQSYYSPFYIDVQCLAGALDVVMNVPEENVVMMLTSGEIFRTGCLLTCEVMVIEGIANPMISNQSEMQGCTL